MSLNYSKWFLVVFAVLSATLRLSLCDNSIAGDWSFDKSKSDYVPLWSTFDISISTEESGIAKLDFTWSAAKGIDLVSETWIVNLAEPSSFTEKNWVEPLNVFEAVTLDQGSTIKLEGLTVSDSEISFGLARDFRGSQGVRNGIEKHVMFYSAGSDTMSYTISREFRDSEMVYCFVRTSQEIEKEIEKEWQKSVVATAQDLNPPKRKEEVHGSEHAYVMKLDDDWKMSSHLDEKLLLLSLQGLSNRNASTLYFIFPSDWDFTYTQDVFNFYSKNFFDFEEIPNVETAVKKLGTQFASGYVVIDTTVRESVMIAFTIAGLRDALVVSSSYIPLVQSLGLKCVADLRNESALHHNASAASMYEWAYNKYGSETNKTVTVWLGGVCGDVMQPSISDFGVASRVFHSDLSTATTLEWSAEYKLAKRIMGDLDSYSMVMGWHSYCKYPDMERTFVTLASSLSHRVEGLNTLPNLSFSSRVHPTPGFEFKNSHNTVPGKHYTPEKKVYVSCVQTDGIGLGAWNTKGRGSMPYSWELPLNFYWLAPAMLEYFYTEKTPNDYFIGAISAAGYVYPKPMGAMLPGALKIASNFMKKLDIEVMEVMDYSQQSYSETGTNNLYQLVVDTYYSSMPDVIGFLNGYAPSYTFDIRGNVPFISFDYYLDPDRSTADVLSDMRELAKMNDIRPYYLLVHVREFGDEARTKKIMDQLGDEFEVVPLDLFLAYAGSEATFKPHFEPKSK